MEKFTKWADKSSGINPFVPFRRRLPSNYIVLAVRFLVGLPIALLRLIGVVGTIGALLWVRFLLQPVHFMLLGGLLGGLSFVPDIVEALPLAIPLLELGMGCGGLGIVMLILPFVRRIGERMVDNMLARVALYMMGVVITEEVANTRVLGLRRPGSKPRSTRAGSGVTSGQVLVCNSLSFIELLYLQRRFSPVFTVATQKGTVVACGLGSALKYAVAEPGSVEACADTKGEPLSTVCKRAALQKLGPVVVMPEGTRSNGRALLRFLPVLHSLGDAAATTPVATTIAAFRYEYSRFSPAHTAGAPLTHLFWTCFQFYNRLRVTYVPSVDVPRCPPPPATAAEAAALKKKKTTTEEKKEQQKEDNAAAGVGSPAAWSDMIRGLLTQMIRGKAVELGVDDHCSFLHYWNAVAAGAKGRDRAAAAELSDKRKKH